MKSLMRYYLNKRLFPQSHFNYNSAISKDSSLGINTVLFDHVSIQNSSIDDYTYIQRNSTVLNATVGKFCSIAANVTIGLAEHPLHYISTSPIFYDNSQPLPSFFVDDVRFLHHSQTNIGSDVWIGQGVMIKSGVNIGHGAVIAAGAIVTKDVEPYSIVAGVPARLLKWRFSEDIRSLLLASQWWEFPSEDLIKFNERYDNPLDFCNAIKGTR